MVGVPSNVGKVVMVLCVSETKADLEGVGVVSDDKGLDKETDEESTNDEPVGLRLEVNIGSMISKCAILESIP